MAIYQRGSVYHYEFVKNWTRYRGSTGQRTEREAKKWLRDNRASIVGEASAPVETLRAVAGQWFADDVEGAKSAGTVAIRLEILFRHIEPGMRVCDMGTPDVAAAVRSRRFEPIRGGKAPAPATVNRDIIDTTLRPIHNYASDVLELPVRRIAWKKVRLAEPTERVRSFTPAERTAHASALAEHWRPLRDFYATYGVRLSEAFFHPSAYDPQAGIVTILKRTRKNSRELRIRLLPTDREAMNARHSRAVAARLDTVWFREGCGCLVGVTPRGYQAASRRALDAAGIEDAKPTHDWRHDAATTMLSKSGNLAAVKKALGHEHIASTMRYAHVSDDDVYAALVQAHPTKSPTKAVAMRKKAGKIKAAPSRARGT
jgi:hypothetical protein